MTLVLIAVDEANDRRTALGRATLHASQLENTVAGEEAALRTYVLTADPAQLTRWRTVTDTWPQRYARVLADAEVADDVAATTRETELLARLHERWLTDVAEPALARAGGRLPAAQRLQAATAGTLLATRIRTGLDELAVSSQLSRDAALVEEQERQRLVLGTAIAFGLLLAALVSAVVVTTRRLVLAPLRSLGAEAREVAAGDRHRAMSIGGPDEISSVAGDVEAMRGELINRIVEQDRLLEALEQQGPAVTRLRAMLVPPIRTELPGLTVTGRCLAGEGVLTGDWYDAFTLRDGRIAITVGDVAGHGTGPAVFALAVKHALAGVLRTGRGPGEALTAAVELFEGPAPLNGEHPALTSAFVAVLDPAARVMAYANAGHPPPLLWPSDAARPSALSATGPVLCGLTVGARWPSVVADLPKGSVVALYTDGLLEARRPGGYDEYGEQRLVRSLGRQLRRGRAPTREGSDERAITAVFTDVLDHAGSIADDATLLLARHDASRTAAVPSTAVPVQGGR